MGLNVDGFAGGGGASSGIELAGFRVDIAINHDPAAIAMHEINHPHTRHYCENIWKVDPREACGGQHVDFAWFSPDCKHFSKASGGALKDRNIRGLAWVVLRWAGMVRPDCIIIENVEEFPTWGPVRKGRPVKALAGTTYRQWRKQLEALGYRVETRELIAADFGAPTSRKRFYLIARCDGRPIVWPEPTHGKADTLEVAAGLLKPWRSAAEIIDWSLACPSIFESKQEIKAKYGVNAVRPLADATEKRIARGLDKFTIKNNRPFIVGVNHTSSVTDYDCFRGGSVDVPYGTVTSKNGNGIVKPVLAPFREASMLAIGQNGGGDRIYSCESPLRTVVSKAEQCMQEALLAPYVVHNNANNVPSGMDDPLRVVTTGGRHLLVSPSLIQYHSERSEKVRGQSLDAPIMTVDAANRFGLSVAHLQEYYGNAQDGLDLNEPMHTVTARDRESLTVAHIEKYYSGGYKGCGSAADAPLGTVTAGADHNGIVAAHVVKFKGQNLGQHPEDPLQTLTASMGEFGVIKTRVERYASGADLRYWPQVRAMLNKHCGYRLADDEVLLLWIRGGWYYIADIGLRMITAREAFRAQGFRENYIIEFDWQGKPFPKSEQMAKAGNSVCPPVAAALVKANHPAFMQQVEIA